MNSYHPPFLLFNKHIETIYPSLIRKVVGIEYLRERITTPDDDFLAGDDFERTDGGFGNGGGELGHGNSIG